MKPTSKDQCLVLPFRAGHTPSFDGIGLALHFLAGNVLVLHPGFEEMWFGWRVKKIFPTKAALQRYCREVDEQLDFAQLARAQHIRVWIHGISGDQGVDARCFDHQSPNKKPPGMRLPVSIDDGLVGFRRQLIDWLATLGWPMAQAQRQAALWPETIDRKGLDAVGRSLERIYLFAYGSDQPLDLDWFERAAALAPASFMAHDLYGWALYRNSRYKAARDAFLTALAINPSGAGAMSGLMWCGVYAKDQEEALYWAGRKADVCGKDVEAARAAAQRRYDKTNP